VTSDAQKASTKGTDVYDRGMYEAKTLPAQQHACRSHRCVQVPCIITEGLRIFLAHLWCALEELPVLSG
jgi:hypothetical protein